MNKNKICKESKNTTKANGGGVNSTDLLAEGLKLELDISKAKKRPLPGFFDVSIGYKANGVNTASLAMRHETIMEAIQVAMQPILLKAPNATQKELDDFARAYP